MTPTWSPPRCKFFPRCDQPGSRRRITGVMGDRRCVALVAALATLAAAAPAQAARSNRLVAFSSCPALLNYAKTQATRFVGPYGFGAPVAVAKGIAPGVVSAPALGSAAADHASAPQQGVDYSGTNVQETGVDEPDLVKTNGNTLFTVTGNQLE